MTTFSRADWDALLLDREVPQALQRAVDLGVMKAVFPELFALVGFGGGRSGHKDLWVHTKLVVAQTPPSPALRWAALFHDCGKPRCFSEDSAGISFHGHEVASAQLFRRAASREKLFTGDEVKRISGIIVMLGKVEQYDAQWTDAAVRRLTKELGALAPDVLAVAQADCTSGKPEKRRAAVSRCQALAARITELVKQDQIQPALPHGLGTAVMERLGVDPGTMSREQAQEMKRIMGGLKALVESGALPRSGAIEVYLEKLPSLLP